MSNTRKDISALRSVDVYSLVLFTLFQMKQVPEYATLSELAYILDKQNLLYLLEYFGGMTITIPTKEELQLVINTLLVYQYVKVEKMSYQKALNMLVNVPKGQYKQIELLYSKVCEVLDKYYINDIQ